MSTRMVALGDSIYAGVYGSGYVANNQRIPDLVAKKLGWQCDNEAVSGALLAGGRDYDFKGVVDRLNFKNYDVVLMSFGVNDFDWSTPSLNDLKMSLDYGVQKMRTDNPGIQIYYELPTATWRRVSTLDAKGPEGWSQSQMAATLSEECTALGICYYAWTTPIITYDNRNRTLGDGITHPTAETMALIAERLANWLSGTADGLIGRYISNITSIYARVRKLRKSILKIFAMDGVQLNLTINPPKESLLNRAAYLWTIDNINHLQRVMDAAVDLCNQFGIVDVNTGEDNVKIELWQPSRLVIDDIYLNKLKDNFDLCNKLLDELEKHMKIYSKEG